MQSAAAADADSARRLRQAASPPPHQRAAAAAAGRECRLRRLRLAGGASVHVAHPAALMALSDERCRCFTICKELHAYHFVARGAYQTRRSEASQHTART